MSSYKILGQSSGGGSAGGRGYTDATNQVDGVANTFTLDHNPVLGTVEAFLDGQRYRKIELVEIPPNQVQTPDVPVVGQNLEFSYKL